VAESFESERSPFDVWLEDKEYDSIGQALADYAAEVLGEPITGFQLDENGVPEGMIEGRPSEARPIDA